MAQSSSSTLFYRQTTNKSVTRYCQMPHESHEIVINMEPYARVDIGVDNHLPSDSGFSTVDRSILCKLVKEKNLSGITRFGGIKGLGSSLKTNLQCGIKGDTGDISRRTQAFGTNSYGKPPRKTFFYFIWQGLMDRTNLVLLACAALSFGSGIKEKGSKDGWYDGGSIFIAIFVFIAILAISEFKQYKQFNNLSENGKNILIDVLRDSVRHQISILEIVVGDIVFLRNGDRVPADGLFIKGYSLMVDESCITEEGDHIEVNHNQNPFLLCGSKVIGGYATMLVTCVGAYTTWGEKMSSIIMTNESKQTPLQERLKKFTYWTRIVGLALGILLFFVLLALYFIGKTIDENGKREFDRSKIKCDDLLNDMVGIIASSVTIVVVAIPVGLCLAVTLTLAYSIDTEWMQIGEVHIYIAPLALNSVSLVIC